MKHTTETLVTAFNAIKTAKLTKMSAGDKFAILRALRALRPVAEGLGQLAEEAREKLRPENFEAIQEMAGRFDSLTDAEKASVNLAVGEYNRAVNECLRRELATEHEISVGPLSEEGFTALLDSNDFEAGMAALLQDVLCGVGGPKE